MEIGNMLFDQADSGWEIPRGAGFEVELTRLFEAVAPDRGKSWRDYGPCFENNTFQIWPYSWCDCDCGFDSKDLDWSEKNHHLDDCYQSLFRKAENEWKILHDYDAIYKASNCEIHEDKEVRIPFGTISVPVHIHTQERSDKAEKSFQEWRKLHILLSKWKNKKRCELCRKFGIKWNKGRGCACHCTCGHDQRYHAWRKDNCHHPRCAVAFKSFLFKPTGFWIDWYKYPLRDAHSNVKIKLAEFCEIISTCIESLKTDTGGPVLRLKQIEEKVH